LIEELMSMSEKKVLNYTTEVPVSRTVSEIQEILRRHGAKSVSFQYDAEGETDGIEFVIDVSGRTFPFRLPANVGAVQKLMEERHLPGYKSDKQPARVAWRILKDWVEAQMAIIDSSMVSLEEVFLPYMLAKGNMTFFELLQERGFLLPEGRGQ
jgi:hypothetical protein